jgi:hypothetical protein
MDGVSPNASEAILTFIGTGLLSILNDAFCSLSVAVQQRSLGQLRPPPKEIPRNGHPRIGNCEQHHLRRAKRYLEE